MIGPSQQKIVSILSDGKPYSQRDLVKNTGLGSKSVEGALKRLWKHGIILRTEEPIRKHQEVFRGRAGYGRNLRSYHLYILAPKDTDSLVLIGNRFLKFENKPAKNTQPQKSKAQLVLDFLRVNNGCAFYSKEIVSALKENDVKPYDLMPNIRRFENKGLLYVRGYRADERETPFKDGYLITWVNQDKPREIAVEEAVERTNKVLEKNPYETSVISRIHFIRDQVLAAAKVKEIVSIDFVKNKLGISDAEAERALKRALQLFSDIKQVKLFEAYRYLYHGSMMESELKVAMTLKENYIRKVKGRDNRIGHNWEACVEWFIDKFTVGASFWTQRHRIGGMDSRRITIHLMKAVGSRKQNAELDRVWEITPGVFANPVTYVLECKWSIIQREDVDDFLHVLMWSKEFGVDTPDGRQVKQGTIGVFAGAAFKPNETVQLKDGSRVGLPSYAGRAYIQLLKASDFNTKLRERGLVKSVTAQKICRIAKNESEVRYLLETVWENSIKAEEVLAKAISKNNDLYEFEKMLASFLPKNSPESVSETKIP